MGNSEGHPWEGDCEVEECYIGGSKEGKIGRGYDKKKKNAVVIEKSGKYGIKRAYALNIKNCPAMELKRIFYKNISKMTEDTTHK